MKSLEKLEAMAEKKRKSIEEKQTALKKDIDTLKAIEAEIEYCRGEAYRKDINKLNLTEEEYERFRKCVLSDKNNLMDVIDLMAQEKKKQEEGEKMLYE